MPHCLVWDNYIFLLDATRFMEYAMAQLVEALRYKPEGRGFDCVIENFH
jgi:hypothetical protein